MFKKNRLKVKNTIGIFFSIGILFFITANALAFISYTPSSPNVEETVTFTVTPPSGDIVGDIKWDFGDGTTQTLPPPNAEHKYSAAGTCNVKAMYGYSVPTGVKKQADTTTVKVTQAPTPSISYSPSAPQAGQTITFTANNFKSTTCIKWDFGDGTLTNDTSPPSITHIYISPGTYSVKAYDNCGATVTATKAVKVGGAERYISYNPSDPRVNEEVSFKANNFFSNQIKWDFGDGKTVSQGTSTALHTYKSTGTYTVKAWDYYGQQKIQATQQTIPPVTTQITVSPDIRTISYTPTPTVTNKEITFTASNFRSTCIKWDFGDDTILAKGSPSETHIYKKEGTYKVSAYDNCGKDKSPKSITLRVLPRRGPLAPFSISFIQLRFEDGKAYKQVPKGFTPLIAFADIKYEGTGILQAQWLVDGKRFKTISHSLPYAKEKTISSGKTPPLPTQMPGIHEVSLHIIKPQAEYKIPIIRYFVSSKEVEKRVKLSISQVEDLEGKRITLKRDHLSVIPGKNYLFSGIIQNLSEDEISFVLLQVSLADKLLDQQMIKKLKPGEKRNFETSILSESTKEKKLTLRVFDTSIKGKVLGEKELKLIASALPPGKVEEITQREELITFGGGADLEICDFDILEGPEEEESGWGSTAAYLYNGGGEYDDIKFRVRVLNLKSVDFSDVCLSITVYSGFMRACYATPYFTLNAHRKSPYFEVTLNQPEAIERGELSPGIYSFSAKIRPYFAGAEASIGEDIYSPNEVTLDLHESVTIILLSQDYLTGSVTNTGDTTHSFLQVGNCGMTLTARGFISFDLSEIQRELLRRGLFWTDFEIESATLEIEEYQFLSFIPGEYDPWYQQLWDFIAGNLDLEGKMPTPRPCSGVDFSSISILLDYLSGYDTFSPSIYNAPMVTNLLTFQSACGVHSFPYLDAYVRYQLERGERKIQFRLRFLDEEVEGDPAWTWVYSVFFRNPRLTITVVPE